MILNRSIWLISGTINGSSTPGQSGPGSNGNRKILHTAQNL